MTVTARRLKILEYVTALLFVALFGALFYVVDYYSAWAIMLLFLLSLASIFLYANLRTEFYQQPSPPPRPGAPVDESPLAAAPPQKSPEEAAAERKASRALVAKICESKNIGLRLKQEFRSGGHYELPEIWTIERAVPLAYEDLYAIAADLYLTAQTQAGGDGILYAVSFDIYSDWVTYEQERN